ncbi:MAG: hypothetical protein KBA26_07205, partial [Candidatus Delongbacteria bacterium]|nr:hypothetical protein [Candidatus Delongbacteria bacterium]
MSKRTLWNLIIIGITMIEGVISLKAEIPVDSSSIDPPPRFSESMVNPQRKIVRAIDGAQQQLYVPPRFITQPGQIQQRTSTSILVTYSGFSAEAQAAFQYAVDIWESMLTTPVAIRVNANWTPLGAGILGSCGATDYYGDVSTWYPVALAEKLNGAPLNGTNADIDANFNSSFASWYLGTDGNVPFDKWDFVSVVLHELCHGLGYIGSFNYSGGQGSWGYGTGKPIIFDRFVYNGSDQALINTGLFANPSVALGTQLTSGNLYFKGPSSGSIKLYAPGTWNGGSSVYHTDHTAHPDDLMNYALYNGTAIHDPGSLVMSQMADIGWGGYIPPVTYTITG